MIVISHLALNEMIKLGPEIVDICLLLDSSDLKLRDLVKQFLSELRNKGNNIVYNLIPKALNAILIDYKHMPFEKYKMVMNELIQNIEKDKQIEGLIGKLLNKINLNSNIIELRFVTYCLSKLNYSEKNLSILIENLISVRKKLFEDDIIMSNIKEMFDRLKKSSNKEVFLDLQAKFFNQDDKLMSNAMENYKLMKKKKIKSNNINNVIDNNEQDDFIENESSSEGTFTSEVSNFNLKKKRK